MRRAWNAFWDRVAAGLELKAEQLREFAKKYEHQSFWRGYQAGLHDGHQDQEWRVQLAALGIKGRDADEFLDTALFFVKVGGTTRQLGEIGQRIALGVIPPGGEPLTAENLRRLGERK